MSLAPSSPGRAAPRASSGTHAPTRAMLAVPSLLGMAALWRLGGAGVLCAGLWAAVFWALGWPG